MSNKPKHTPGPWKAEDGQVFDANGFFICGPADVRRKHDMPKNEWKKVEQTARLIAAAPELLEAAKKLVTALEEVKDSLELTDNQQDDLREAKQAIAKAEGK